MDLSPLNADAAALVSRIAGKQLQQEDISPLTIFTVALICILRGVVAINRVVTVEEEAQLANTLRTVVPADSNVYTMLPLLVEGVEREKTYLNPDHLLVLTAALSDAERLLMVGLGYELSAADGEVDFLERMYLQSTANRLGVDPNHTAAMEAGFTNRASIDMEAWGEVQVLLDPQHFAELDPAYLHAADRLLSLLATSPQ